jgi:predicted transcriptional regulator
VCTNEDFSRDLTSSKEGAWRMKGSESKCAVTVDTVGFNSDDTRTSQCTLEYLDLKLHRKIRKEVEVDRGDAFDSAGVGLLGVIL